MNRIKIKVIEGEFKLLLQMLTDDARMDDSSGCVISDAPDAADHSDNMDRRGEAAMMPSEQPLFFMDKVASKLPVSKTLLFQKLVLNISCCGSFY